MALAPSPTATVEIRGRAVTVYAAPAKSGKPRNRYIIVCVRDHPDGPYAHEILGGSDRDVVTRKAAALDFLIDTTLHTWTPTPARNVRY